jgi:hypothetical protein
MYIRLRISDTLHKNPWRIVSDRWGTSSTLPLLSPTMPRQYTAGAPTIASKAKGDPTAQVGLWVADIMAGFPTLGCISW